MGSPSLDDFETFDITVGEVNQPPVLAAIGNKSVDEGSLLTFTASATDPDLPANNLSFSLDAGAPPGATIDPSTGQFSWTPPGGTSPGNHTVTVRVSDDGVPSLDDFETITITVNDVNLPPVLAAIGGKALTKGARSLLRPRRPIRTCLPITFPSASTQARRPGRPSIRPPVNSTGRLVKRRVPRVYSVTVRVTDDGTPSLDDFETINITVVKSTRLRYSRRSATRVSTKVACSLLRPRRPILTCLQTTFPSVSTLAHRWGNHRSDHWSVQLDASGRNVAG